MSGSMHGAHSDPTGGELAAAQAARARSRDRLRLLAEAIEAEIVPRLVAGFHSPGMPRTSQQNDNEAGAWPGSPSADLPVQEPAHRPLPELLLAPIPQAAIDLAALLLTDNEQPARAYVVEAITRLGLETLCLDVLAPAARHLGDLWDQDVCSFSDVTIGLMRLQSALIAVTTPMMDPHGAASPRRTALLSQAPGDQHNFGIQMVGGFLERAGWTVTMLNNSSAEALEAAARSQWFGVLGVSAGSSARLQPLSRMLLRIRAASRNPDLAIMLGGPLFLGNPDLAAQLGADATAADGPRAVQAAESLIAPRVGPRVATG